MIHLLQIFYLMSYKTPVRDQTGSHYSLQDTWLPWCMHCLLKEYCYNQNTHGKAESTHWHWGKCQHINNAILHKFFKPWKYPFQKLDTFKPDVTSVKANITSQTQWHETKAMWTRLTTSKRSHLCILCVHLVDVGHATAQVVDGHVIPVPVFKVVCFILRHHHLVPAVTCVKRVQTQIECGDFIYL